MSMPTPPSDTHAFVPRAVHADAALGIEATLYDHPASGARVLDLQTADSENLLALLLLTPPPDDRGLPHIMEHAVLGGSRKYPVKDPFFHMLKMSMATFLNAMTGPDYTIYPCASNVEADFFNLAEVYLDAIFHPLLHEVHFRQEGFHFMLDPPDPEKGHLTARGIVYNEMRGAYSSPNEKMQRLIERGLFPDAPYGLDAGGDPDRILELQYADFLDFHRRYYHPSNALIVRYGNIAPARWMPFLDARLAGCGPGVAISSPAAQPRWETPRRSDGAYPIGPEESPRERAFLTMSWLTAHRAEPFEHMAQEAVFLILLGHSGAPLHRALIDSRLGHDLTHCYTHAFGRELTMHVGLKGSEPERFDGFRDLVNATLERCARPDAIDEAMIETALTRLGYVFQEINDGFPLKLASLIYRSWAAGGKPFDWLQGRATLERLRERVRRDPPFFARFIREKLLDNPHRLDAVLRPDRELGARAEAALQARFESIRQRLTPPERAALLQAAGELEEFQRRKDPAAALDALPQLRARDLPPKPRSVPTTAADGGRGTRLLRNDVPANGVNYLTLAYDLNGFTPAEMLRLQAVYVAVVLQMGAAGRDFAATAERIAAHSGDLHLETALTTRHDDPEKLTASLLFSAKFLDRQTGEALDLIADLLFRPEFGDRSRLADLLSQMRARHRGNVVENALRLAMPCAARHLGKINAGLYQVGGLRVLRHVDRTSARFSGDPSFLPQRLADLHDRLFEIGPAAASFTGSDAAYGRFETAWRAWTSGARRAGRDPETPDAPAAGAPRRPARQGLAAPMDVAFNVMSLPLPHSSHPDAALLEVGLRLLSFDYLLDEIRFKGSAYGAGCAYHPAQAAAHLYSYRDPAIARTLKVFRECPAAVRAAGWRQADIDRGIIGAAKNHLAPLRPESATRAALLRHLRGVTDVIMAGAYERLLAATPESVTRAMEEHLVSGLARAGVCVVADRGRLDGFRSEESGMPEMEIENILE